MECTLRTAQLWCILINYMEISEIIYSCILIVFGRERERKKFRERERERKREREIGKGGFANV